MNDLVMPAPAAEQLAYHMRMAVAFAAADDPGQSASAASLASTILSLYRDISSELDGELPDPWLPAAPDASWDSLQRRTGDLARELQAHFVSEGQFATADVYEAAAARVERTIAAARARR